MAKVNIRPSRKTKTYEGGRAIVTSPEKELTRLVMTCMLFEDTFYEKGSDVAKRAKELCTKVSPEFLAELAIKARNDMHLRSIPLYLTRELARNANGKIVGDTIFNVIQRADELSEFLAMYFMDGKQPLSKQVKVGLSKAFVKFSAYQLAKYDRNNAKVRLRDVLFLCHAKPKDKEQEEVWGKLIDNKLESPDTWETQLSAGKDKKLTFERLISENKLGYMALLRNLRNMEESGCDINLITKALDNEEAIKSSKVLPFRFTSALRHVYSPVLKSAVKKAFSVSMENLPVLDGKTVILVDVSGSMEDKISDKSDITRIDAAASLAAILKERTDAQVFTFSYKVVHVSSKSKGLDLAQDIVDSQEHGGTALGEALETISSSECKRVIVLTDEQSEDSIIDCWAEKGYIVNLCGYKPSVTYAGKWESISGWSDKIVNYIHDIEKLDGWDK